MTIIGRHAGGAVHAGAGVGLAHAALHAERAEHAQELLPLHVGFALEQASEQLGTVHLQPIDMHPLEDGGVDFAQHVEQFGGVERLRQSRPVGVEDGRNAVEIHIVRHRFEPALHRRVEVEAVNAAIGEQLHHLDAVGVAGFHGRGQPHIVPTFLIRDSGFLCRGDASQQRSRQHQREDAGPVGATLVVARMFDAAKHLALGHQ